jgi:hypothetical protein
MCCIKRNVRYNVMILHVICRLMCATVPRAHIRFMHYILSLKWGVIAHALEHNTSHIISHRVCELGCELPVG